MCLPVGQCVDFRPFLLIDALVALNEGKVRLGRDVGGAPVSRFKSDCI